MWPRKHLAKRRECDELVGIFSVLSKSCFYCAINTTKMTADRRNREDSRPETMWQTSTEQTAETKHRICFPLTFLTTLWNESYLWCFTIMTHVPMHRQSGWWKSRRDVIHVSQLMSPKETAMHKQWRTPEAQVRWSHCNAIFNNWWVWSFKINQEKKT